MCLLYKSLENTVRKGEIACNEHFLLFPHCFLTFWKTFSHDSVYSGQGDRWAIGPSLTNLVGFFFIFDGGGLKNISKIFYYDNYNQSRPERTLWKYMNETLHKNTDPVMIFA